MKIKNIIILAAGDGTRFWPLEKKSLFSFLNKPLLLHLIQNVASYANHLTLVVNQVDKEILQGMVPNGQIIVQDSKLPGMAGALHSCQKFISGGSLVLNAEDIFDYEVLQKYIDKINQKSPIVFLGKKVNEYFPGGYFKFENNQIKEIIEKPPPDQVPSNLIKLVADYFPDFQLFLGSLLRAASINDDYYEKAISLLLQEGRSADYIEYNSYWYVLKFPWHVLSMMQFFLEKIKQNTIHSTASISKKAIIVPPVVIGSNVKVGDFTKIVGPVFINDGTIIGDYALVRQSHIGKGCLVGGYSEVTRSYLADNIMLHRNYVGDSVLADNVLMGAGAVTANFRFDQKRIKSKINKMMVDTRLIKLGAIIGKNSKIGVNATLLPGIKIGKKALIGPGELVKDDVEDGIFLFKAKKKNIV